MIPIFTGYDEREPQGWETFVKSVLKHSTSLISVTPLDSTRTGTSLQGTNAFTYSRYLIPYLMGYQGSALYVDGVDMLLRADIKDLWNMRDPLYAVQVVPHNYSTTQDRKYIGTSMESPNVDYPRKNWSSVMLINCAHRAWRNLTPQTLDKFSPVDLHRFRFIPDRFVGYLPIDWNHLVGEYPPNEDAKLVHFTLGIPSIPYYGTCEYSEEWKSYGGG